MSDYDFRAKKGAPCYLTVRDVAIFMDVKQRVAGQYLADARMNYRRGTVKPSDMPLPDALAGFKRQTPLWRYDNIREWLARRPYASVCLPVSEAEGLALLRELSEDAKD